MKVISYRFHVGYGFILQALALQKYLRAIGYSVKHLKLFRPYNSYVSKEKQNKYPAFIWKPVAIYRKLKAIFSMEKKFFHELDLKFTKSLAIDNDKCFIVGSDQIWNPDLMLNMEQIYFLEFTNSVKKISYAASLGMQKWPKEFEQRVLPLLQKFHAISVREESSVKYLHSLGLNAVCVCDPTILHKADFYRKEFSLKKNSSEDYIFTFRIRENIPILCNCKTITVHLHNKKTLVSVSEWLSLIDNAEFVLTDSFHCVVFCILFHKQFAVFQNKGKEEGMNERFTTILGKTGLEYRILQDTETEEQILTVVKRPIDWVRVDAVLDEWRHYSANWLNNALIGENVQQMEDQNVHRR